jgi:hypothetical protein
MRGPPIFLRLALHSWRLEVFDLEPMRRSDDETVPALCAQLLENAVHVNLHGSITYSQLASDLLI